ncbi:hypothetical protein N9B94_03920 [Verrucomicrobia bacterium]|nr:hypothetical protein [Verrucomicrobiota bacterium]
MAVAELSIRPALEEDLDRLIRFWKTQDIEPREIEPTFPEFQIVMDPEGNIVGCVALRILAKEGVIHSLAFCESTYTEQCNELLWSRLRKVADNHGLFRLWASPESPWAARGFASTNDELRERVCKGGLWNGNEQFIQIREELEGERPSSDQEFEFFQNSQRAERGKFMAQTVRFRNVTLWIKCALLFGIMIVVLSGLFQGGTREQDDLGGSMPGEKNVR